MSAMLGFLRDLQGAATAAQLYPREHPRLVDLINGAVAHAHAVAQGGDVSAMVVDGRLVIDNREIAGQEQLVGGIFSVLARHGHQRLTLRAGLTADELYGFAVRLAHAKQTAAADTILHSSDHIRLSAMEAPPRGDADDVPVRDASFDMLAGIWSGLLDRRQCDIDALQFILVALAGMIEKQAGGMIPLAALRNHDDYTLMHITNVAMLAMALADSVGLPTQTVNEIGTAALLHDVGKLRVPADILNAPGRLTHDQAAVVKRHPEEGARVLLATPGVSDLSVVVAFEHHIQFDGGGYPVVPRRWKLNLAGAITTVADVFDALRSDRPYRKGLSRDRIKQIMTKDSGTVFDPDLVRIFFEQVAPRAVTSETVAAAGAPALAGSQQYDGPPDASVQRGVAAAARSV
ncbi:MAG: HD-GYP domain-containing protein [Vicinamibacterales bacterium]